MCRKKSRFREIIDREWMNPNDLLEIMAYSTNIQKKCLWDYYNGSSSPDPVKRAEIAHFLNKLLHENTPVYSANSFDRDVDE